MPGSSCNGRLRRSTLAGHWQNAIRTENTRTSKPLPKPKLRQEHGENTMTTGWKASKEARRPHTGAKLKRNPPSTRISRKRLTATRNAHAALRAKGLL